MSIIYAARSLKNYTQFDLINKKLGQPKLWMQNGVTTIWGQRSYNLCTYRLTSTPNHTVKIHYMNMYCTTLHALHSMYCTWCTYITDDKESLIKNPCPDVLILLMVKPPLLLLGWSRYPGERSLVVVATYHVMPPFRLWAMYVAVAISLEKTPAARPYSVALHLSSTSSMSVNFSMLWTGPNI